VLDFDWRVTLEAECLRVHGLHELSSESSGVRPAWETPNQKGNRRFRQPSCGQL